MANHPATTSLNVEHAYRLADITHSDATGWSGIVYGPYLPEDGLDVASSTLEGLKEAADRQSMDAYREATGAPSPPFSSWTYRETG